MNFGNHRIIINCQNKYQNDLYEGIKVSFPFNNTEKSKQVFPEFKYFLNTRGVYNVVIIITRILL